MSKFTSKIASVGLTAITVVSLSGFAVAPAVAQTSTDIQAQITALLAQIASLQSQLGTGTSTGTAFAFTRGLTMGSKGDDVTALQNFLKSQASANWPAGQAATGYFGSITKAAVAAWQAANGVSPAAGYFGAISKAKYLSMSGTGTGTTTTTPTVPVSGAVAVSVAANTPVAGTIIADTTSGDGAQALVDVLVVNFSAGSSEQKVTSLKVKRTGISSNGDVSNIYLYDGATRIAEFSSYTEGVATFTNSVGLFTVSPNSTKTITVKMDLANGTTSGKTIGFNVVSASDVVLLVSGTVSGTFPLAGNLMTTATVADLGKIDVTTFTTFPATMDPGQTATEVWRFNLVGSDQNIDVSKLNLTMVGTITSSDVQNIKLMVGGVQIGSIAQISSNNEVLFDFSAAPYRIASGQTKTVTVVADVVGGTSRAFKFTIRKTSDVAAKDANYNVWLKPLVSGAAFTLVEPETGNGTDINNGKLTVTRASDSPSSTTANNATGVTLAKFDFKATGENIKIETIVVEAVVSEDLQNLNNGKVLVDGSQVGTTVDFDGDATDDANFTDSATDANDAGTDEDTSIALGNTFIIPAGTTRTVTLVADTKDGDGNTLAASTTIRLSVGGIVATGQTSLATITVASADGNSLTATSGALTTSKNLAMADATATNPTGVSGTNGVKISSFIAQAGAGEGVSVTQIVLKDDLEDGGSAGVTTMADLFQNLKLMKGGVQVGSTVATLTDTAATTYTFSVSPAISVAAGSQAIFDVFADLLSSASADNRTDINADSDGVIILDSVSATGLITSTSADDATDRQLQLIEIVSAGTFAVTSDSASPASTLIAGTGTELEVARFTLKETTGAEGIKITQIVVTDTSTNSTAFSNVRLFVDGAELGAAQNLGAASNGTATFSGLSYTVPANTTKTLVVKATPNAHPNGTANVDHTFTLAATSVTATGASSNTSVNAPAVAVTSNAHTWARTSLATTGAVQGALSSRVRTATDLLLNLSLTSGAPYQAALRGSLQANDEAITNWAATDADATAAVNASVKVDGTNSIQSVSAADTASVLAYDTGTTSAGLQNFSRVSAWVNIVTSAGTSVVTFAIDDTALLASPEQTIAVATATTTATWYYVDAATSGLTSTSRYVGAKGATAGVGNTATMRVDNVRFYNDSLVIDVTGSLKASLASHTKKIELKDSSDVVKAVGYANTTVQDTATVTLTIGDDAGSAQSTAADLNFSTTAATYKVVLSSVDHVLTDAGATAEAFTLNIDLGNATTDGDIRWYDGAVTATAPLTWVSGSTPIQASVSYQ